MGYRGPIESWYRKWFSYGGPVGCWDVEGVWETERMLGYGGPVGTWYVVQLWRMNRNLGYGLGMEDK